MWINVDRMPHSTPILLVFIARARVKYYFYAYNTKYITIMSKVILITGGSSGLGEALCTHLASVGHKVYGTSRKVAPDSAPSTYQLIAMDVWDKNSVRQAVDAIVSKEGRLDVVINNAGLGMAAPLEESSADDIDKLLATNVRGVIHVIQAVLPQMRKQQNGQIINISSIAAEIALPFRGLYCASKAAVEKYTQALRMEVKDFGIQACTFQAGDIKTNINANRLTAEIVPDSAYATTFRRINDSIHKDVNTALSPLFYARKIEKMIAGKRLRRTYVEGPFIQRLSRFLSRVLPGNLFEKIILNHYKL
jgi:NAD(P)-dependent dehydrogenase (short-subunit alcohol dehydrogenase family)